MLNNRILLAVSMAVCAVGLKAQSPPELPYYYWNVCPSELCEYGTWSARQTLVIHEQPNMASRIVGRIQPGVSFQAPTGVLVVTEVGTVIVADSIINRKTGRVFLVPGDSLYVLAYEGEGYWATWSKGERWSLERYWRVGQPPLLGEPTSQWWVMVDNREGVEGWTRLDDNSCERVSASFCSGR